MAAFAVTSVGMLMEHASSEPSSLRVLHSDYCSNGTEAADQYTSLLPSTSSRGFRSPMSHPKDAKALLDSVNLHNPAVKP